jgi:hypothetical protein
MRSTADRPSPAPDAAVRHMLADRPSNCGRERSVPFLELLIAHFGPHAILTPLAPAVHLGQPLGAAAPSEAVVGSASVKPHPVVEPPVHLRLDPGTVRARSSAPTGTTVRSCDVPLPSWVNNRDVELRVQGALKGAAHTARRRPFRRVVEVWFSHPPSPGRVQTAVEAAGPSWRVVVRVGPDLRPRQSVSAFRGPGSDGGAGVREPRRPRPPSGSGHLQIGD